MALPARLTAALVAVGLLAPAAAPAHVTLQPDTAVAGSFTRLDVRVPNERDDAATTRIDVQLPDGIASVSHQPVAGWTVKLTRGEAEKPVMFEGVPISVQVERVTISGGRIGPGQFQDFPLALLVPKGRPGTKLTFKALQTYDDGEVVRWIGAPDSDEPAAQVELIADERAGPAATPAAARRADEDSDPLAIAALVVGGIGLLAGGAALARARASQP